MIVPSLTPAGSLNPGDVCLVDGTAYQMKTDQPNTWVNLASGIVGTFDPAKGVLLLPGAHLVTG